MSKVNEKWDNELSLAFGRVIREIQLGKLAAMPCATWLNTGDREMTSFCGSSCPVGNAGVSMAKILRIQSIRCE